MAPLYVDVLDLAQKALIAGWVIVFLGVVGFGSALPALAALGGLVGPWHAKFKRACRLAALGMCALGWVLVPDTFAVESRSEDAVVALDCAATGALPGLRCADGTLVAAEEVGGSSSRATLYRLSFSGIRVHFEAHPH